MVISKILTDLCFTENKKYFCKIFLQCISSVLTKQKEVFLSINGAQSVRSEKRTIGFKNYFELIPVSFKIYADFDCNLNNIERIMKVLTQKSIKIMFLVVLLTNLLVLMIKLAGQQLLFEAKMLLLSLLKQFLRSMSTVKK